MPYVMLPVPEEHVMEVMDQILRIVTRASTEEWDQSSLEAFFHETDEATRSVLSVVARGALSGRQVTDVDAAALIDVKAREIVGILREVNGFASKAGRHPLLTFRPVVETLPNGRSTEKRLLGMTATLAGMVQEAERAERLASPHPLTSDSG